MRHSSIRVLIPACLIMLSTCGCHRRAPQEEPTPRAPEATDLPLPEWAPANPSPEFLRAAKVLKPLPLEMLKSLGGQRQVPELVLRRYVGIWPAAYEFFGTLTDEQIKHFRNTGEVRIRMGDLTEEQRKAFDHFIEARNRALEGDLLVSFYKAGATKDLSNVEVGFLDEGGHIVSLRWWVLNQQDPAKSWTGGDHFAML
jgi:hypothetical protein